jgi:aspartyl-tRNA(Asn)/glutamyl-tRNA(Gln) amidotransferase subunit C
MPSLSRADVRRIAALARLELADAELEQYAGQLTKILEYAASVQAVPTENVPPYAAPLTAATPTAAEGRMREDVSIPSLPRTDALANAPQADTESGTFVVPKVIG